MAVTLKQFTAAQYLTGSAATYYTATNCTARVDNCTFTNTDTVAVPVTVYIIASGGTASADETIISAKSLSAGECYTCPELVGKTIPSGSFVQALAGTTNKVVIHMSGIEVT
jgi:hypothetical protein